MKKTVLFFAALLFLFNCTSENEPESNDNLILNSSFENDGQFDSQNWLGVLASSSTDTPNSSAFSLKIEPALLQINPPHEGFAETIINDLEGAVSLHFSCDTKINSTSGFLAKIIILKEDLNGVRTEITSSPFDNTDWQNINFDINVNLQNTDKLIIHLSAGSNEMSGIEVLFDNIIVTLN